MVLDECLAYPAAEDAARASMERTLRWTRRARDRFLALRDGLVPGANRQHAGSGAVRDRAGRSLSRSPRRERAADRRGWLRGYAIGGLSVGEPSDVMYEIVSRTTPVLPADQPRYLMGTGTPEDLVESVARGIDLFDCVLPTRNARNGQLFTSAGRINIKNARYAEDESTARSPLRLLYLPDLLPGLFTASVQANEINSSTLNTLHNLHFYLDTLSRIRDAIVFGRFESFRLAFRQSLSAAARFMMTSGWSACLA